MYKVLENLAGEELQTITNHRQLSLLYNTLNISQSLEQFSTTWWEQITCIGYNADISRLEAIVSIKQTSGYSGNLCSIGSTEYVRFFIDYHDGAGFQDAGLATLQVHDISEIEPGLQHPIQYVVYRSIDVSKHNKFISCEQAVIPTVRAILSWNTPPPADPDYPVYYGNVLDADIQLKAFEPPIYFEPKVTLASELNLIKPISQLNHLNPTQATAVILKPTPDYSKLLENYQKAGVPQHRYLYSTVQPLLANKEIFANTVQYKPDQLNLTNINLSELAKILAEINNNANVIYEELTCVGLNTSSDTLGAVVKIKLQNGYSGNLCETGSQEHIAFWVDWDNDGVFEEYAGTASFEIHDISNMPAEGIYYNVNIPLNSLKHRKTCLNSNVIRVRGVLSWETLPSTTDPNDLQYWGNRVDSLVQVMPGEGSTGNLDMDIFTINGVPLSQIDFATGLAYRNTVVQNVGNNLPFGCELLIEGRFYNSGPSGNIHYKIQYSTNNGMSWSDVTDKQRFQMYIQGIIGVSLQDDDPTLHNNWLTYRETELFPVQSEAQTMLGIWNTGGLNGKVLLRFVYTNDPFTTPFNPSTIFYSSEFAVMLDNTGFNVNPAPVNAIDFAYTLDLALDGLDCAFVHPGTDINGHLRAVDTYFSSWALDIFPGNHYHAGQSAATTIVPQSRACNVIGDSGDATTPFVIHTANLDSCGYALRLQAWDRCLCGYKSVFPDGSYHSNLTSHYGEKYVGFAVLPS